MRTEPIGRHIPVDRTPEHGVARRGARPFRKPVLADSIGATRLALVAPSNAGDARSLSSPQRGACSALWAAVERVVRAAAAAERADGTVRLESGETATVRVRADGRHVEVTIVAPLALAALLGTSLQSLVSRLAARGLSVRSVRIEPRRRTRSGR
jgi:hypothetical protein